MFITIPDSGLELYLSFLLKQCMHMRIHTHTKVKQNHEIKEDANKEMWKEVTDFKHIEINCIQISKPHFFSIVIQ
jgi:hypothetical protein